MVIKIWQQVGIQMELGGARIKNLLVAEIGRWLHADALSAKNSRTTDLIVQLANECDNLSNEENSDDE